MSFLVPSNVPGSSQDRPSTAPGSPQDRPRVTQDAKGEAPSMPNDTYGNQNPPKINKNQGLDLKVLFCCLLCSPMSQNWPRVPQHAKVKQPIMPNDRFAYQRCQDALATMPRICNPEAMGNDRGTSAEGVAHKIRRPLLARGTKAAGLGCTVSLSLSMSLEGRRNTDRICATRSRF